MSQITLASNAAGTATFTLASPATNTNQTLTLPDQTGTLATTADAAAAASAAAATAEGMVLLGTLSTGAQSLSGLNLTGYKQLFFDFIGISHNNGTATNLLIGSGIILTNVTNSDQIYGGVCVSLWAGVAMPVITRQPLPSASGGQLASTGYTNATTAISVTFSAGTMDAGSVRVYGVK